MSRIINIEDAEEAADQLRKEWELGFDPIVNVTSMLEEHGIRVIMLSVSEGFDGFSCFANKTIPVIVSQANIPGDRQRFNLIHELGHLMLDIAFAAIQDAAPALGRTFPTAGFCLCNEPKNFQLLQKEFGFWCGNIWSYQQETRYNHEKQQQCLQPANSEPTLPGREQSWH